MGILGIGSDIVEIYRIKKAALSHPGFLSRVFKPTEICFCQRRLDPWPGLAARFAAKEAVFKALGTGLTSWHDLEITGGGRHPVQVVLTGAAQEVAHKNRVARVLLSVSHDRERAIAFATAVTHGED